MTTVRVRMTTPELYAIAYRSTIFPLGGFLSLSVSAKSSTIWLVFGKRHMGGTVHPALRRSRGLTVLMYTCFDYKAVYLQA